MNEPSVFEPLKFCCIPLAGSVTAVLSVIIMVWMLMLSSLRHMDGANFPVA